MNARELAYITWKENTLPSLSLDEILTTLNLDHYSFRKWLVRNRHELYKPTTGMISEIHYKGYELTEATQKYHLTRADAQVVFYRNLPKTSTVNKFLAQELLEQCYSNDSIASLLNCSPSRISQIKRETGIQTTKKAKYKRLRQPERVALREYAKTHSKEQTAKEFNVSIASVYRIIGD